MFLGVLPVPGLLNALTFCEDFDKSHTVRGLVMSVVTIAMMTIIAKRRGEMIPRSRPTFRTINSTRPRVFISTPRIEEDHLSNPTLLEITYVPPNLPRVASNVMSAQIFQSSQ